MTLVSFLGVLGILCGGVAVGYVLGNLFPLATRIVKVPREELFTSEQRQVLGTPPRPSHVTENGVHWKPGS